MGSFPGQGSQDAASLGEVLALCAPTLVGSHRFPPHPRPAPPLSNLVVSFVLHGLLFGLIGYPLDLV